MLARYRSLVTPLALVAAVVLVYMENPWFYPADGTTGRTIATVAFWILAIVVLVLMFDDRKAPAAQTVEVEGPAFTRYLFSNTRAGLLWLPIRIFLGFEWLVAGCWASGRMRSSFPRRVGPRSPSSGTGASCSSSSTTTPRAGLPG